MMNHGMGCILADIDLDLLAVRDARMQGGRSLEQLIEERLSLVRAVNHFACNDIMGKIDC